ncbi:GNAT family N-acetyltransferase [Streptomyces sp. NPDC088090]|uniref:GNAT family N-acetyltransferase n=1 Tax=Streptomyces sp. NPDC088090 TaxID=3365822 RepID=UPI00384ED866
MTRDVGLLLPEEARARRAELIALCAQAFGGAPWHEPPSGAVRTVDRLLDSAARRPDFRAAAALGPGGELLGLAAGWTDTALSGAAPAFELAELVVAPAHQGRGLGRALHDVLLASRPAGPALLMTLDVPELTDRYARWGWTVVDRRRPGRETQDYAVLRHP